MATTPVNLSPISSSLSKTSFHPNPSTLSLHLQNTTFTHKPHITISCKTSISDNFSSNHAHQDDQNINFRDHDNNKPREVCGVVGIYGDPDASRLYSLALHALQHCGQEGAGIVTVKDKVLHSVTGVGLVSEVFSGTKLDKLPGEFAIGHVRYSTASSSMLKNVQPFVAGYRFGSVGVAYNGNLVNYKSLRVMLEDNGSIFNTSSNTEVVLHLIAISKARPFFLRIVEACEQLHGVYSLVFVTEDKFVAVRDLMVLGLLLWEGERVMVLLFCIGDLCS